MLQITHFHVSVDEKAVLNGIDLSIKPGTIHAIMGPNGSGKSSLAHSLMGHPWYAITQGEALIDGQNLTVLSPDARARAGLFLAFQHPEAIPGVSVYTLLREAHAAVTGNRLATADFQQRIEKYAALLAIELAALQRSVNDGFSGGEKKRFEILQLLMLKPKVAILDEIDSGLDIDALKIVCDGIAHARRENPSLSILLITHYQRILRYLVPDCVHVLHAGRVVASGGVELVESLEQQGYQPYIKAEHGA